MPNLQIIRMTYFSHPATQVVTLVAAVLAMYSLLNGQVEIQQGPDTFQEPMELPPDDFIFNFGPAKVRGASIFHQSSMSLAFVNKKPVVPGHVLVVTRRNAAKLEDLEVKEITDLFSTVQKVDTFLQRYYKVDSTTVSLQSKGRRKW